ncbi:MAG: hypothetical protein A2268_13430 [Candidatus Raymondbacteria bacterium RifOxyA12_full_50_37]|uniref:FlgD/Vpr Ig-like domain-containing protein n=1 Tax=Candidatus Raymondbacteria bacterium RIFOXYD12_FULL_49_13 TaxID=1817890 RepID=A0A1F7F8H4_UNCRA|nr:MAG: hypothetical protein A2268_13430 [Candidatus Raymondbacteria bacterium RifOxyA12_full_50_37]OGJ91529.1 MAG: hypothetical protein A2248_03765 [Candidatus Raymondbacteria bacterium RIFOXYA2_FULL_49_16]OGJ93078.1 MAG: hypothetical protein A2350_04865 [Candidatus Raymondbacteria bacterium RifOxyB12_full_50_8]OGJ97843.1 MAG: hypothetical protein A2453_14150 [Candidatus Raymondbacteria bacterium RIFOXYC2_FULL_50_21]OGK02964.1 MAG: hypothetical protein A2519_06350 [Candidatus Raymondbacteria b
MRSILLILITIAIGFSATGDTEIKPWKNGAKASLTIGFDWNYGQELDTLLTNRGLHAYWAIWSGLATQKNLWSKWQTLADHGHEINTINQWHMPPQNYCGTDSVELYYTDVREGVLEIERNIPGYKVLTAIHPNTYGTNEGRAILDSLGIIATDHARGNSNFPGCDACERGYKGFTYEMAESLDTTISPNPFFCISRGNFDNAELDGYKTKVTENAINKGGFWHAYWHGVSNTNPGLPTVELFIQELDWLKSQVDSNNLWVGTFRDLMLYMQERVYADLETSVSNDTITITVTDTLIDSLYDAPLTIETEVPEEWLGQTVYASQNNVVKELTPYDTNGAIIVMAEIIPDLGPLYISLSPVTSAAESFRINSGSVQLKISPNPANPSTQINCFVPGYYSHYGKLPELRILDSRGRIIKEFKIGKYFRNSFTWDGRSGNGKTAASGVYTVVLTAGNVHLTKRVTLLK